MTMGLRRMKAAPSAAISYLSVVWGALAGFFIFHEHVTAMEVAGSTVICLGTMAVVVSEGWQQRTQDAQDTASWHHESALRHSESQGSDDEESQLLALELSTSKAWSSQAEPQDSAASNGLKR